MMPAVLGILQVIPGMTLIDGKVYRDLGLIDALCGGSKVICHDEIDAG
jgi:hypothetical protein